MKYWVVEWPKRDLLIEGFKEGIPPYPLKDREVILDMKTFVNNWFTHRRYAIFHSVVFPPDIANNSRIRRAVLEETSARFISLSNALKYVLDLEKSGVLFCHTKLYKKIKLPEMLAGLGT